MKGIKIMSNDCLVMITSPGQEQYLYTEEKGFLAHSGSKVAQIARQLEEGKMPKNANYIEGAFHQFDFVPVTYEYLRYSPTSDEGDINHFYRIDITERGNVFVEHKAINGQFKRYKVDSFIKKVNRARRNSRYDYKMLRLKRTEQAGYSQQERLDIANTILEQMGGTGRLTAMIGMYNPMACTSPYNSSLVGLKFHFKGSRKANICQVTYMPGSDTYLFELYKFTPVRYAHCPLIFSAVNVYFDMLQELFTSQTGLDLHL
ncbi:MAG: hypothetical protein GY743_23575 [Planctomycetaceae bacterium]|nr:hypothetical protein [Planctomycetaceae bacterium]